MIANKQYSFWGDFSPLGGLQAAALLVIASARLSWAVVVGGSLIWVYCLTTFSYSFLSTVVSTQFFPKNGRHLLFNCLACFFGSTYLLLFWLLCPLAAFELFLPLLLVPLFYVCCGIFERIENPQENSQADVFDHVSDAFSRAAIMAGLIIAFSIIREPLAFCAITLPGTHHGIFTIMYFRSGNIFPIGIFASSAGALLLLGYVVCLYQYSRNAISRGI